MFLALAAHGVLFAQPQDITAMEYYVDADPGVGNGTAITITAAATLDINVNVPTASLSPGMHVLVVRAQDQSGDWSIQETRPFFVAPSSVTTDADITDVEYFLDSDPGPGGGTAVAITPSTTQDLIENIPTGGLSEGFHVLHVRARDSDGNWSIRESRPFFVSIPATISDANVVEMEYFLDTDPGFANGVDVPITPATSIDITENIPTSALTEGFHVVHFRALDSDGAWSIRESRPFFVSGPAVTTDGTISQLEYYIDADPGPGAGTQIAITSGTTLDIVENIPTGSLAPGFHVLHVRARDTDGAWSVPESRPFFVTSAGVVTQATITEMEYFFDSDPGVGNGTDLTITAAADIDLDAFIPTSSLTEGFHTLNIRARDNDGNWSLKESRPFYVDALGLITKVEYYLDTDPGVGSATDVPVTTDDEIDITVTIPTSSLPEGTHTLGVRVGRDDETWSDSFTADFSICTMPVPAFSTDVVCEGGTTTFTDQSTNASGALYSWDFESDGTIDDTAIGSTAFDYPAAGSFTAMLILNRNGCIDTVTANVIVAPPPVADAGTDQSICDDNTTLNASSLNAGETGAWTIITGSGNIADPTNPSAAFTDITSYSNTLEWTVTVTAGGCVDSDQVVIVSNQPIAAAPVSASVSLGETINRNVQAVATINPGDVLETTIITQPTKGTATILSDGTINYTPEDGTVGADVVVFQLCNQCNRCATSNFSIDIVNDAPVITPAPVSVSTGEMVTINLLSIISDPNNNLDPASLTILEQPISGAVATIDASYNLIIDYTGVTFNGTDWVVIQACDLGGECATNQINIEVDLVSDPPISVFNALSPNGDGKHDFLEIENITAYPNNHIYVVNRWGDKIYEADGYDNANVRFDGTSNRGSELPSGTYFYSIDLGKGGSRVSGYLVLKR